MSDRRSNLSALIKGITTDVAQIWRQMRWNPLRNCTPQRLAQWLDEYDIGWVRNAALAWEFIEKRDDMASTVIPKRKKAVSHRPWAVVKLDQSPAADAQFAAVEAFFNHLTVTDALDLNVRGDFSLLIRQMMDAQFKGYAAHEIIWKPGKQLRAELKFVQLYLFENTTGKLRYTGPAGGICGVDLDDDWMVTVGDCLMQAISVCWMFKKLSLSDWLNFSERFGIPGIHGMTSAQMGTPEWDNFIEALSKFANDWIMASAKGDEIKLIEAGKTGEAPFQPMVDRMDAAIARLVRGGDLSTISKKDGVGASLQGDETDILEQDDCKLISSHLQVHLVRKVIAMTFGSQVEPLVYIEIQPTPNQDIKLEMEVDNHFEKLGIPQSKAAIAERYGRPLPEAGEDLVGEAGKAQAATRAAESATASSPATSLANEATAEDEALREAVVADLAPIYEAIAKVLDEEDEDEDDDEVSFGRLRELNGNWAEITDAVLAGEAVEAAMTRILGEAFVGGLNLERIARDSLAAANANPYHDSSTGRFMRGPTKTGQPHQKTPASLRTSISEVLQSAMDEPDSRDYVEYSQIDDIEAAKLKALPGAPADLPIEAGWKRVVTAGEARHIIGKHWKDPRPVRPSDFDKLPELLAKPKAQKWITRHGVKPPILETTIDDKGELYVVEELRTGRKTLSLLSMFRK